MKTKFILFVLFLVFLGCSNTTERKSTKRVIEKPKLSLTFDDGITRDFPGYPFEEWNNKILDALEQAELKAIFFVTGFNKLDSKGKYLLESWDAKGHGIANHTFTHPNYNDEKYSVEDFELELLQTDSVIRQYKHQLSLFRFPYLKEGKTTERIEGFRNVLKKHDYKNGYVTIDASDWYVNSRMIKKYRASKEVDLDKFRQFYLDHLLERANYYESLAFDMHKRHISHTLLLHHNLTSALFLGDLIEHFRSNGWEVINATQAYKDEVYDQIPASIAGESLIWSQAKATGNYEDRLRYPAEDSRYEKARMDDLGL